ncbi:hypothetical protein F4810DRAFT_708734 [Camillea tinctor]|nr:hypothetical protein F4810DRAFT_708734 [Camillea tinctor]
MDDFRATLERTANAFLKNNTLAVKQKDVSLFSAILSEDCIRIYRPLSFIQKTYPKESLEPVIDTTQRRATIWTEQTITTLDESKSTVELIWDLDFTEDGKRVSQILEFVDTAESIKVLEQMLSDADAK